MVKSNTSIIKNNNIYYKAYVIEKFKINDIIEIIWGGQLTDSICKLISINTNTIEAVILIDRTSSWVSQFIQISIKDDYSYNDNIFLRKLG